jgi:hypothetical protein
MTEKEKIDYHDPGMKLFNLPQSTSERKLRLFACACCRQFWDWFSPEDREGVSIAERYADRTASEVERRRSLRALVGSSGGEVWDARPGALSVALPMHSLLRMVVLTLATNHDYLHCRESGRAIAEVPDPTRQVVRVAECSRLALELAEDAAQQQKNAARGAVGRVWNRLLHDLSFRIDLALYRGLTRSNRKEAIARQETLFHDIFGNPFRPVTFSPEWRTGTAVDLARTMYESRDFSAMPILADALQDAGCDNDDILSHCRDSNPTHVRGCWVVDLVLERS